MEKEIKNMCLSCGRMHDKKKKLTFGAWIGTCDMCGKEEVPCASAQHDFGYYNTEQERKKDKIQDMI